MSDGVAAPSIQLDRPAAQAGMQPLFSWRPGSRVFGQMLMMRRISLVDVDPSREDERIDL